MPNDNHIPGPNLNLNSPQAGGFISASEYRHLKAVVTDAVRTELQYGSVPHLRVFRLTDPTKPATLQEQTGYVQYWDPDDDIWRDNTSDEKGNIASALLMAISNEGRTAAYFHRQSGLWVPLSWHDGLMALTPSGGIPARSGTTLGGPVDCDMYWDVGDMGGSTITLTAITLPSGAGGGTWQLPIYNVFTGEAIGGSKYVVTRLLMSGRRYVSGESCS